MGRKPSNKRVKELFAYGLLILATGWAFSGCKKGGGDCFTSTGKIVTEERFLPEFDSIEMNDNVNVILTQDSVEKVEVESGKNIINKITTEVSDRQLVIHNENTCNWVRSYSKPINVHIHVKNIWKIYYNSSGDLTSANTITSDSIKMEVWGGAGTINMEVNTGRSFILMHLGSVDLTLSGHSDISSLSMYDYGKIDLGKLKTAYTFVVNGGSNNCYVNASTQLDATINSIGNIYYTGNPGQVSTHINGAGEVIPY